eukprot:6832408-Alexandrium_andersonii.AAC.1
MGNRRAENPNRRRMQQSTTINSSLPGLHLRAPAHIVIRTSPEHHPSNTRTPPRTNISSNRTELSGE